MLFPSIAYCQSLNFAEKTVCRNGIYLDFKTSLTFFFFYSFYRFLIIQIVIPTFQIKHSLLENHILCPLAHFLEGRKDGN